PPLARRGPGESVVIVHLERETLMRSRVVGVGLLVLLAAAPAARGQQSPEQRARSLNKVKELGGKVFYENDDPQGVVVGVELFGRRVTDDVMPFIRGFLYMRRLHLCGTRVTDAGLAYLSEHAEMRELFLTYGRFTGKGVEKLRGMTKLEVLGLSFTDVGDDGL